MKTASIRELKHDTAAVLGWVETGEPVEIRRRGKSDFLGFDLRQGALAKAAGLSVPTLK